MIRRTPKLVFGSLILASVGLRDEISISNLVDVVIVVVGNSPSVSLSFSFLHMIRRARTTYWLLYCVTPAWTIIFFTETRLPFATPGDNIP